LLLIKHREEAMQRTRHLESPAMRTLAAFIAAAVMALLALPVGAQSPTGIAGVVAPGVEPHLVQEGFVFTEGPVGTPDGGLYFSDIRRNWIYRLDSNGEIGLFREQTNGANGLAVTREGDLLAAEGEGKRISKRSRDGTVTTVTEGIQGKPFLAPNDLILDAKGGIYFTDPVVRRRHGARSRGSSLHHDPYRRSGVRRRGQVSRHDQGAAAAGQCRLCRTGQARALHFGARRSLSPGHAGARPRPRRQMSSAH
jgi:hypothetical protein